MKKKIWFRFLGSRNIRFVRVTGINFLIQFSSPIPDKYTHDYMFIYLIKKFGYFFFIIYLLIILNNYITEILSCMILSKV